jgi:hypothetical protein
MSDKTDMSDRRTEARLLCSDLMRVDWRDTSGRAGTETMNLEDISPLGACFQSENRLPEGTHVSISYDGGVLTGIVEYCIFREIGFFLGIKFTEGCTWPADRFSPKHLFDPRTLVERAAQEPSDE